MWKSFLFQFFLPGFHQSMRTFLKGASQRVCVCISGYIMLFSWIFLFNMSKTSDKTEIKQKYQTALNNFSVKGFFGGFLTSDGI